MSKFRCKNKHELANKEGESVSWEPHDRSPGVQGEHGTPKELGAYQNDECSAGDESEWEGEG